MNPGLGALYSRGPLSAPGGHVDPVGGSTDFPPVTEFATHQYQYTQLKQALSDSGVPGGSPPPDAAVVGERPTSSAAQRPSTPRPQPTQENLT